MYLYVGVSIFPISMIFIFNSGIVPIVVFLLILLQRYFSQIQVHGKCMYGIYVSQYDTYTRISKIRIEPN